MVFEQSTGIEMQLAKKPTEDTAICATPCIQGEIETNNNFSSFVIP